MQKVQALDEKAGRAIRAVKDQTNEATDSVQAVAGTFYSALDKSVRKQPMTTLALGVAAGFVLGALWKS